MFFLLLVFMHMSRSLQTYSMCGDPIYGVVSPTSLMSWDELQHEFRRHEKHSILIENLSPEIPNLPLNVLSSLYAQLSKFGQPLTRFKFCEKGTLSDSLSREKVTQKKLCNFSKFKT